MEVRFTSSFSGVCPEDYIRHIRKHWSDLPTTFTDTEMFRLLEDMRRNCRQSLLPLESFSWLESSERACFFGWHTLMDHLSRDPSGVLKELSRHSHVSIVIADYLSKNKYPSNARGQLIQIIRILDLMSDQRARNELLERIKQSWIQVFKIKTPFREVSPEDNDECQWTWDQLKKQTLHWINIQYSLEQEKFLTVSNFRLISGAQITLLTVIP